MSVIKLNISPPVPSSKPEKTNLEDESPESEIRKILNMTENARDRAKGLGLKFEAYLLHTAVLALSEQLDREEYPGI